MTALEGMRNRVGQERILALLEPRSNTMRMGVHRDSLASSLVQADEVWLYAPPGLGWDPRPVLAGMEVPARVRDSITQIVDEVVQASRRGDHVLIMSNGAFGGIHQRLLDRLGEQSSV